MARHQPAAEDLEAEAEPLAGPDPLDVPVRDIPLPPPELRASLDNAEPRADDDGDGEAAEVATLEFVGDDLPEKAFSLRHPFRWSGRRVDVVTVRQLTVAQVGRLVGTIQRTGRTPELFDVYAEMTGLPAKVLRAIPSVDGEPIIGAAFDFLPPLFRPGGG